MSTMEYRRGARRWTKLAVAGAATAALLAGSACSSDKTDTGSKDGASKKEGAARMAFAYGYGGGGPEGELIAGLNCYAAKNGLSDVTVTYADGDASKMLSDFDSLTARSADFDGIFALPNDPVAAAPAYKAARNAGLKIIDPMTPSPDGSYPTDADSHVAPDDPNLPQMVVDGMAADDSSIKNIVILSPPPGQAMTDMKTEGIKAAGKKAGINVVKVLSVDNIATDQAQKVTEDFLTGDKNVQAVFAHNGAMARGAALAAKSQGVNLKVYSIDADPETVSAVAAGEIYATYGADLFQVGYQSSEQVEKLMKGDKVEPILVPYTRYDAKNNTVTPLDKRCS